MSSRVAHPSLLSALALEFPLRHRTNPWSLVYSTALHGMSLQSLYRRAQGVAPSVLLVRDMKGYVFGAYVTSPWRVHHRYYGEGETFVFRLSPRGAAYHWDQSADSEASTNQFFQLGEPESIALGGDGGFALRLDGDLKYGSSRPSGTFRNPILASTADFMVETLEVWWLR